MKQVFYKFKPEEPLTYLIDILVEHRLYCATYLELNDPFEGQFVEQFHDSPEIQAVIFAITRTPTPYAPTNKTFRSLKTVKNLPSYNDNCRVCSLTSKPDDVRMWSLYASGHKGVAFELDLEGFEPTPREVTYTPELKAWGTTLLTAPSAEEVLTYKTKHWKYESEFRIITNEEYVPIAGRTRRVILGARATQTLEKLVRKLAGGKIEVTRAVLDADGVRI